MTAAHAESVSVFHFCADDFAKRERLSAWQELLGRKVLGMETEPLPNRPFHFDMKLYALSGLSLMVGRGSGIYLHRTKKLINNEGACHARKRCQRPSQNHRHCIFLRLQRPVVLQPLLPPPVRCLADAISRSEGPLSSSLPTDDSWPPPAVQRVN
jgi:hypothetical protein